MRPCLLLLTTTLHALSRHTDAVPVVDFYRFVSLQCVNEPFAEPG